MAQFDTLASFEPLLTEVLHRTFAQHNTVTSFRSQQSSLTLLCEAIQRMGKPPKSHLLMIF